jgi:uridine kinase
MLEDVLLITEKHRQAAADIVKEILKNRKEKFIVGISGESGSGKSELTHVVAKELFKEGIKVKPVHIDNFYNTHPLERNEYRKSKGVENVVGLSEYRWDDINKTISDFKNNRKSTMPCVDLVTQDVDQLTTDFNGVGILIIDGLYAINTEGVDLAVFIELTYHETKKAQEKRGKEATDNFRFSVLEAEHQAALSIKPKADLFVNMDYKVVVAK